jgi:hypothetical protein
MGRRHREKGSDAKREYTDPHGISESKEGRDHEENLARSRDLVVPWV